MAYGLQCWTRAGELIFDSSAEHVLFFIEERQVLPADVGGGLTFTYPSHTGRKIAAFLTSPYQTGDLDAWSVQSCRVTYPGGVPTVTVFFDNVGHPNKCDGLLMVFGTGSSQ